MCILFDKHVTHFVGNKSYMKAQHVNQIKRELLWEKSSVSPSAPGSWTFAPKRRQKLWDWQHDLSCSVHNTRAVVLGKCNQMFQFFK